MFLFATMTDDAGTGDECTTHPRPYCYSGRTLYCLSIADTNLSEERLTDNGLAGVGLGESKNVGHMLPHSSLTLYLLLTCCAWRLAGEQKAGFALHLMAPNNIHHYACLFCCINSTHVLMYFSTYVVQGTKKCIKLL